MDFEPIHYNSERIVYLNNPNVIIKNAKDALTLLMESNYVHDTNKVIITQNTLTPEFFDLKTGVAGEIAQKFVNYNGYLAIIGDFSIYPSKSLQDFMYESNKTGRILFVEDKEKALSLLTNPNN